MNNAIEAQVKLGRAGFALDAQFEAPGIGITGLFGPSGAGKTTLLRCIAGLERAPQGRVRVNGTLWQDEAQGLFVPTHRRALGMVFQEASLFDHLSVHGNLDYARRRVPAHRPHIGFDEAVDLLGLGRLMERAPRTLSGGERQRVAIARALLASPDLLLADEPLASLDTDSKAELLPYLERLHDELKLPCLYVSHGLDELLRIADHLLLIRDGRIVSAGNVANVLASGELGAAGLRDASVTLPGHLAAHDPDFQLSEIACAAGRLWVPKLLDALGTPVRIRVRAQDVSLSVFRPVQSSTLNLLPATVRTVTAQEGEVLVLLDAGGDALFSRLPRKAATLLGLAPGLQVHAQIQTLTVLG
jgi:molybdate transport system ATP-binding protein